MIQGHTLDHDVERTADVAIIGSGAGGSVLAAGLAARGLDVVVLEEGGFHTKADFVRPDERWSYPNLYQERGSRSTADLGITILQGRGVGGGTLINWTTCFRTPDRILEHWRQVHGHTVTAAELAPHFAAVEERLGIFRWPEGAANANNSTLRDGAEKLGWEWQALRRNVRACANSGMCGLGCPVDAKQAMHLTFLADATSRGATVYSDVRAVRIERSGGAAVAVHGVVMTRGADRPTGRRVVVRPKVTVVAGGAINSPALLLRSGLEHPAIGRRTWLHPVVAVLGRYAKEITPYAGAPQSISSHQFVERDGMGFFLEAAPMQPMLVASAGWTGGSELSELMGDLRHLSGLIALHIDGLSPDEEGGTVTLKANGAPRVDYPMHPTLIAAFRDSHEALARIHLAAGAEEVFTTHRHTVRIRSDADLGRLADAPYGTHEHGVFTAHQMGGCAMGADPVRHVVDLDHRVRGVERLFVVDGSVLPTALGVNPSQTLYGLAHRAVAGIAAAV